MITPFFRTNVARCGLFFGSQCVDRDGVKGRDGFADEDENPGLSQPQRCEGSFFKYFFQCDGSTVARTRFTAGGVPLDDSSAGGGWDLLDDSPVLSLSPLLSLSLSLYGGSDAQYVARHVGFLREIPNATPLSVATFARTTPPFHPKRDAYRKKPTAMFVRKKGICRDSHPSDSQLFNFRSGHDCTAASSARSPRNFCPQTDVAIPVFWRMSKMLCLHNTTSSLQK